MSVQTENRHTARDFANFEQRLREPLAKNKSNSDPSASVYRSGDAPSARRAQSSARPAAPCREFAADDYGVIDGGFAPLHVETLAGRANLRRNLMVAAAVAFLGGVTALLANRGAWTTENSTESATTPARTIAPVELVKPETASDIPPKDNAPAVELSAPASAEPVTEIPPGASIPTSAFAPPAAGIAPLQPPTAETRASISEKARNAPTALDAPRAAPEEPQAAQAEAAPIRQADAAPSRGVIADAPKPADKAPPQDAASNAPPAKREKAEPEVQTTGHKKYGACFVKVEGRIYVNGSCEILREGARNVTFNLQNPVTVAFDHGRTWFASMGKRELGKVFKRGACWGSKQIYICEHTL